MCVREKEGSGGREREGGGVRSESERERREGGRRESDERGRESEGEREYGELLVDTFRTCVKQLLCLSTHNALTNQTASLFTV